MTKRQLIDLLGPFDDDQYVFVNLHSDVYPTGSQVIIQGVRPQDPWRPGPPPLVGLLAHTQNAEVKP